MSSRLADKLAQLEQGLQSVLVQEAEIEARLEQLRDARKRQEGAVLAVRQLVSEEAEPVQDTREVNDGALH
jgi:predicted  nucleic acid-binding Zn-ribbon protein